MPAQLQSLPGAFRFHVDAADKSAEATKEPANEPTTRWRVLIVDDERLVRWSVAETLGARGYEVTEAADAASAIHALSAAGCATDVVLLELDLPDSDDLRVLSTMRRLSPTTSVIVMTAYGTPELVDQARRFGAFAVVDKPFEMDDLPPLVDRALAARPH